METVSKPRPGIRSTQAEGWQDTGDLLLSLDGVYDTVDIVRGIDQSQVMYNLTVELAATYLVGAGQRVVSGQNNMSYR